MHLQTKIRGHCQYGPCSCHVCQMLAAETPVKIESPVGRCQCVRSTVASVSPDIRGKHSCEELLVLPAPLPGDSNFHQCFDAYVQFASGQVCKVWKICVQVVNCNQRIAWSRVPVYSQNPTATHQACAYLLVADSSSTQHSAAQLSFTQHNLAQLHAAQQKSAQHSILSCREPQILSIHMLQHQVACALAHRTLLNILPAAATVPHNEDGQHSTAIAAAESLRSSQFTCRSIRLLALYATAHNLLPCLLQLKYHPMKKDEMDAIAEAQSKHDMSILYNHPRLKSIAGQGVITIKLKSVDRMVRPAYWRGTHKHV